MSKILATCLDCGTAIGERAATLNAVPHCARYWQELVPRRVGLDSRGAIVLRPCAIFLPMAALEFEPSSNRLQEIGE
jgi:hypothetical protein